MDKRYRTLKKISNKFIKGNTNHFSIEDFTPEIDKNKIENLKLEKADLENDTKLIKLCRKDKKNIDSLMCIRSRISNSIYNQLQIIIKKYGGTPNEFNNSITFVLEDDGQRYYREKVISISKYEEISGNSENIDETIKNKEINEFDLLDKATDEIISSEISTKNDKKKFNISNDLKKIDKRRIKIANLFPNNKRRRDFNYEIIELLEKKHKILNFWKKLKNERKISKNISPFSAEIIIEYNPEKKSNLDTFTNRKVTQHLEIRKFMREEMGISNERDWSILGNRGIQRLIKSFEDYGDKSKFQEIYEELNPEKKIKKNYELKQIVKLLLESYKKQYSKINTNSSKWSPTSKFLSKLNPPLKDQYPDLLLLNIIANAQRIHMNKTTERIDEVPEDNFNKELKDDKYDIYAKISVEENAYEYLKYILGKELYKSMKYTILKSMKKWDNYPERKQIWMDFAKGYEYPNQIAERSGYNTTWIHKIIQRRSTLKSVNSNIFINYLKPICEFENEDFENYIEENDTEYFMGLNITTEDKISLLKDLKEIYYQKLKDPNFIKDAESLFLINLRKTSKDKKEEMDIFFSKIAKAVLKDLGIY